ncbi:hypothetical protein [Geothrix fermentans]|uniref:hypothetical protein n=1 Tax=Geothrix fermentans TaxID=44676 RepID=UPI00042A0D34|nr:hypothetical protein [Geothrix fermentans]
MIDRSLRTFVLATAVATATATMAAGEAFELKPPAAPGRPLQGTATAPAGTEWVVVFYRVAGEEEFSSFNLDAGPDGTSYAGQLEAALPAGAKLEYYAALRTPSGIKYLPREAPASFASLQLSGTPSASAGGAAPAQTPAPAQAQAQAQAGATSTPPPGTVPGAQPPAHGPIYFDGAFERVAHHQEPVPGEARNLASGQIRLAYQSEENGRQVLLNARLVYTNQPLGTQSRWSLGDLQAAYAAGNHRIQLGDMVVQESEFTLAGAGRRGLDYAYAGQPLGAHLFALNTQAHSGTEGLAWPEKGSEVYGGSLGYGWLAGNLRAKVVFLSGKDDPATAVNLASLYAPMVRDGSTGSFVLDGRFFDSRLAVSGEYARSLFTKDLLNQGTHLTDQAWRLGAMWMNGPFSAQLGYRDVGRDFGTVGVAFFVGDRRTLNGSVGFNRATWSLSATAVDERTNPTGQPGLDQAWNQSQSLDARVGLTQSLFWRVGLRHARQEAELVSNPLIPFSNSNRAGFTTGLDLMLPPASSLAFNAQFDRLRSEGASGTRGTSTTFSLGGSLGLGARVRLSPNLSWSRTLSDPGDQKTTMENAFLNADVALVPGLLGFLLNGGVSRTILVTGDVMENSVAEGTLRLFLDTFLKGRGRASLGLKGRYTHAPDLAALARSAAATGVPATGATAPMANDTQVSILLNVSY